MGPDHDAPLDLRAEALASRARKHREEVATISHRGAVLDAIVTSQIGARLGWCDDVVGREGVTGVRHLDVFYRRTKLAQPIDCAADRPIYAGIETACEVLTRHADAQPADVSLQRNLIIRYP